MCKLGFCVVLLVAMAAWGGDRTEAATSFHSFDGPELTWQLVDGRPTAHVLAHGSAGDEVRQGSGSERITVRVPGGESLHFSCSVGRLPVMDELESRIWLKATCPGAKIAARIMLPRTADSKTGVAKSVLVSSDECAAPDRWQQLRIANIPGLLSAQVRVLRAAQHAPIDAREAYVDAIVLVLPGGPNNVTVWTDALEVDGVDLLQNDGSKESSAIKQVVFDAPAGPPTAATTTPANAPVTGSTTTIQFRGTTLLLAGRPFLPRGIEWNNEPLAFLAERGFNTIWLDEPPTSEQSAEAARTNLWFVCTPPAPDLLSDQGLGQSLDRVLAWNLGSPSGPQELDYFRRWAKEVRERDSVESRPILLAPRGDWLPASQMADALVAEHAAASSLDGSDFGEWLQQLPYLARPGTPIWSVIPTQPAARSRQQLKTISPQVAAAPTVLGDDQVGSLVMAVATSGCRGILYRSDSPLNAGDLATRRRAALVEQWNDRLDLIEPWLTIGKQVGDATSTDGTTTGIVLQAERARLFLPTSSSAPSPVTTSSPASNLAFIVPGVPVSNETFMLSTAGFSALVSKRVAGGTRIEVPRDFAGYVLMTEDAAVISGYRQRVARGARRTAQLQYGLAATQSRSLAEAAGRLRRLGVNTKQLDAAIGVAEAELKTAASSIAASNFDVGFRQSSRALRSLAQAVREMHGTIADGPAFDSVPFAGQPTDWIARVEFDHSLAALRAGENQLAGGDFEDLEQLRLAGWQHVEDPISGIETKVELAGSAPREGRYSLQLVSQADSPSRAPQIVARAPVWISSPPLRATAGELLEISGWVRVDQPISGNVDALEIVDTLGGRELALRIRQTDGWQPFRLIRGTDETKNVTLTFALHGLGTAAIDGVMVRSLAAPKVKRLPTTAHSPGPPAPGPAFPSSARRPVYPQSIQR